MRTARSALAFTSLAAVALVVLTACGDTPSSSTSSSDLRAELSSIRPCELLTSAEIEAATGRAPGEPQDMSQQAAGVPMCNWPPAGGRSYDVLAGVMVTGSYFDSYDEYLKSTQEGAFAGAFTPDQLQRVDAGDFGVWMEELGMLQVYQGDRMVQISVSPAEGRDRMQAARELALAAHARL